MKDTLRNRRRLGPRAKLSILRRILRENGFGWTVSFGTYYLASALADRAFVRAEAIRRARGVPGLNSREVNREIWSRWDWGAGGEEWTRSASWKSAVVRRLIERHLPAGAATLEIGPGGGRWTEELLGRCGSLVAFDISPSCVELCRERFSTRPGAAFHLTDGASLPGVADGSIDFVWSFDVFVHINSVDVERYLAEIARVLAPRGTAVLHHGTAGGIHGGWRSDLTEARLDEMIRRSGLVPVERFSNWTADGVAYEIGQRGDAVTVLRSPPATGAP